LIRLARSGTCWRDIPARYGSYALIKVRYYQWVVQGIYQTLLEKASQTSDMAWLMVDATHISNNSGGLQQDMTNMYKTILASFTLMLLCNSLNG